MFKIPNMKGKLIKSFIVLFLITMLIFPSASYQGASTGLLLWFHTILPNLLPFIIISNLMIRMNITKQISVLFYPLFKRIFQVSPDGCYPILIGFLSGIPVGAKATADLFNDKKIHTEEGNFLLTMCNNVSPMFIMSYIAISQLKLPRIKYTLFVIIYCSSIISALIYRFVTLKKNKAVASLPTERISALSTDSTPVKRVPIRFELVDNSIMNGFEVITKIGGYVILFSILAQFVHVLLPDSGYLKQFLMGILEITTGINQICLTNMDINLKIVLVAVLTSFGGFSSIAQTKSVLGNTRLSLKSYCAVKLISAFITLIITYVYVYLLHAI
ncbi:MAG: putative rane protein [Herbinix sp.]|jgi:sporulation integral membrane protein YlbJ|nr:putative rane protein [Herbinix sp.]